MNSSSERECEFTIDGKHHYAPRNWLGANGGGKASDGSSLLPWVKENYHTEIACVCRMRPKPSELPAIREALKETAMQRALRFGGETAEQGRLL